MAEILELESLDDIEQYRPRWHKLLAETPGATFFQSPEWLEAYWRYLGHRQKLRLLVVMTEGLVTGIVPLVVRTEKSRFGRMRVLTFPLHDWGSFYGPISPQPFETMAAAMEHIQKTPRNWDILEPRWQGALGTDPMAVGRAMSAAGLSAYPTVWEQTHVVDLTGGWDSYWSSRQGSWLRRFRHSERKLSEQGKVAYLRYRPRGVKYDDGEPRWELYEACEALAERSWQGSSTDGTTLSHREVRAFLRAVHEAAAAAGALDLNLLLLGGRPVAFIYGYHRGGYVYGLRRGYDAEISHEGPGNVLLAHTLRDSFARGDHMYDMGVGSYHSKRHFQTRRLPILRFSHFAPLSWRAQLLRARRWFQAYRQRRIIAGRT